MPPSQELGCSYADVAAQDGEAVLRAILASQQPNRCKRAQAFISTQGLRPDTVAALVAEEVTRELLTPSEGTGALLPGLPGLSDHSPAAHSKDLTYVRVHPVCCPGKVPGCT